jgi:hypothetical protein
MTWIALYPWLLVLHVSSALAFMAIHGVSMGVWWRVHRERDRAKLVPLLELSLSFVTPMLVAGSLLIASGILVGVAAAWWFNGDWWLWVSIVLLVVIVGVMTPLVSIPIGRMRRGLGMPNQADREAGIVPAPVDDAELDRLLSDRRPAVGASIAIAGIVLITWLMETKPF